MKLKDLQPGDIIAYKYFQGKLVSDIIRLGETLTGNDPVYTHIGIWDGKTVVAALWDGVDKDPASPIDCDVFRPNRPKNLTNGLLWLETKVGHTEYFYFGLFWVLFTKLFKLHKLVDWSDSRLICSALGAEFLNKCGVEAFPGKYCCEIMPSDFANAKGLTKVGSL